MAHISYILSICSLCLYAQLKGRWVSPSSLSVNVSSLGVSSYSDIWLPICVKLPCRSTLMETFCQAINCGGTLAAKMWANNTLNCLALTCHASRKPPCGRSSGTISLNFNIPHFSSGKDGNMKHGQLTLEKREPLRAENSTTQRIIKAPWYIVMCWFTRL